MLPRMLFLSHIFTAMKLQEKLEVQQKNTYYFASVLSDIRYVTNLGRNM